MNGGEIFIQITIYKNNRFSQILLTSKIEKKIIGIQPGEKLHETMFTEMDCPNIIEFKDYFIIVPNINFFKKQKISMLIKMVREEKNQKRTKKLFLKR